MALKRNPRRNNEENSLSSVKKKKSQSVTMFDCNKYIEVPDGWDRTITMRTGGASAGKYDVYYHSPFGKKLRSRKEVEKYCEANGIEVDIRKFQFSYQSRERGSSETYIGTQAKGDPMANKTSEHSEGTPMIKHDALRKNDILEWRRLKGDYVPKNQIWMVLDEESDSSPSNSQLDNSVKRPDSFVSNSSLESKEINCSSSSIDTNLYYNNRLSEENSKLRSKTFNNLDSEEVSKSNESKTEMEGQILFTYSRKSRFSHLELNEKISRWESNNDNDEKENTDNEGISKSFRTSVIAKSVYNFDSESESENNEKKQEIDDKKNTYSRKSRISHRVKSKRNSREESSNDDEEKDTDDESANKKSRKRLKVVHLKAKKDIIPIAEYTLKDLKDLRNSTKRQLINYSTTTENSEQQNIRSSIRERKTVNYAEDDDEEYKSDSEDSEYVEETESEDENRNKMKKKVESSDMIVKTSHMSAYEQMVERNKEANRRMLEEMGILQAKNDLQAKNGLMEHKKKREYVKKNLTEQAEVRRSLRMKLKK